MAASFGIRSSILPRNTPRALSIYNPSTVFSGRQQSQLPPCRRPFSHSQPARARSGMMSAETIMPKLPPERSLRSRLKDMDPESIPTDFGVLPGTFIKPEGKDMPSLFSEPKDRLMMEWVWIKTWFTSVFQTILYHKWYSNPRQPLNLGERKKIGKGLHELMYTEFARGNERFLRARCSPGLAKDLIRRIRKRNPKETLSWNIEKYNRTPSTFFTGVRVLSDRATAIPELADSGIRQIILRITSQQRSQKLTVIEENGQAIDALPKIQDCTEYVVIQKVRIMGKEKEWEIWGFTKPTTLEELDSPFFASGMSLKDRLQAMQDRLRS
ncbi:conserved hypothetical protein [Talaromyces stipitatus ATCC 10500]|uniref:Tim44-like domain-containing protein n=1 Tax=Talaromyces stipitatus (strain ATCC 10500 / CBS 375.48 / QM 6759 / NRRL 1006) TaxID=441959 RepID=B8MMX9_TALSN|nr:uncharacterized protein TSTA_101670 [Talaromyces stipitatus ATCC 10500]XP_002486167.1 uncharacterized protein TSTA_101670 [Talaromyces stipitatus ATCC 10500]EED13928.1 conserved hypothetical protein [Talaromyces stipitatus ATCC 10500]EED13929.1 conserved hypothetical protein [Talaromyces stipitatus ATCC 10500]